MLAKNAPNMTASTNDLPPNGVCLECRSTTEPILIMAFLDQPAHWIKAPKVCNLCIAKEEAREKALKDQRKLDEAFRNSKVSLRFKQRTLKSFVPTPDTQSAYEVALNYQPKNEGLLLTGPCGIGKTHLAAGIANAQLGKIPVLFVSCPEFLLELRETINSGKKDGKYSHLLTLTQNAYLLILDDIGAEKSSDWVQETLFVLINYRYEKMLPTILTTNCSLDELEEKIGKRSVSRLIEMCRCIRMEGDDWRIKARKQKQGLFNSNIAHPTFSRDDSGACDL